MEPQTAKSSDIPRLIEEVPLCNSSSRPDTLVIGANPESAKLASFPAFDWLRIVLASVVVLGHEGVTFPGPIDGQLAVEVFFALSGWLIGGILLETDRAELPRFFFNRATRIWIPYAAAVALLYGFAAVYEGVDMFWVKYLFFDTTFTHQIFTHFPRAGHEMPLAGSGNQFWSISVEEQFYLVAPIVILLPFGRKILPWVAIAVLLLVGGVLGTPIAFGVIAAILKRSFGDWQIKPRTRMAVAAVTLAIFGILFMHDDSGLRALFAIGLVLTLAVPGKRNTIPVFLGGISYPVYLNHWVGAFVAHGVTRHLVHASEGNPASNALYVAIAYPFSLIIGAIAYFLIDRQVLARRQFWFKPRRGILCGATAYILVISGLIGGALIAW
ncbi:acyltransferase family protein [Novosphingobium sp.]|uniref:acyltransferase family protein n=1 Tax=Novosphingobium sp. TaxID=1874826 RepID=UPI003B528F19